LPFIHPPTQQASFWTMKDSQERMCGCTYIHRRQRSVGTFVQSTSPAFSDSPPLTSPSWRLSPWSCLGALAPQQSWASGFGNPVGDPICFCGCWPGRGNGGWHLPGGRQPAPLFPAPSGSPVAFVSGAQDSRAQPWGQRPCPLPRPNSPVLCWVGKGEGWSRSHHGALWPWPPLGFRLSALPPFLSSLQDIPSVEVWRRSFSLMSYLGIIPLAFSCKEVARRGAYLRIEQPSRKGSGRNSFWPDKQVCLSQLKPYSLNWFNMKLKLTLTEPEELCACSVLCFIYISVFILMTVLWRKNYNFPHFTDGTTEAQRIWKMCYGWSTKAHSIGAVLGTGVSVLFYRTHTLAHRRSPDRMIPKYMDCRHGDQREGKPCPGARIAGAWWCLL
jgi:hypothetical protein